MTPRRLFLKTAGVVGSAAVLPVRGIAAQLSEETITGTITGSDPTDPLWEGYHTEPYEFDASSGDTIQVSLSFQNADPWIHIDSPSGSDVVNTGSGTLEQTLEETGTYIIYPQGGAGFEEPGSYTLELTISSGDSDGGGEGTSPAPIEFGQTVSGNITNSDPTDPLYPSYHTEPYTFEGTEGDQIEVTLSLSSGGPWIHLEAPSGQAPIDAGNPSTDTITRKVILPEDGTYTLYPQAFPEEAPGQYELTLELTEDTSSLPIETPPPAYVVDTEALAASPTRAIFSINITPQPGTRSEYDGSVGGLSVGVSGIYPGLQISRITKLPNEEAELTNAAGSLVLSTIGAAASGVGSIPSSAQQSANDSGEVESESLLAATTAVAVIGGLSTVLSLGSGIANLSKKSVQVNIDSSEGTKTALFTGDASPLGEPTDKFFGTPADGKYLIEVESTEGPIADLSSDILESVGAEWGNEINFFYQVYPSEAPVPDPDYGTETPAPPPVGYSPTVLGDLTDNNPFVDHVGFSTQSQSQSQSQAQTVSSQQEEQIAQEESANSAVQKPSRQKTTLQTVSPNIQQYDEDSDGEITASELGNAVTDFARGELSASELGEIVTAFGQS